jgi:NADH dehydrogenase/NADH:ubiquinone oxidoreductase subunit G
MGALTLKSFPFELRGWEIEKFESIDPTDGFGSNTRVYINKNQIVLIEPDYNVNTFNTWLTDKGRQFFDGIFGTWKSKNYKNSSQIEKKSWHTILKTITQALYMFDHCNAQKIKKYFFTVVFENLSIEILSLLVLIAQNYSFIKLRRAEKVKINNDLESSFQLNSASNNVKLSSSNLCLLLSTNPRYEGFHLNLSLRKRFFKGNFKCLAIGSIVDLTFPVSFLGSNLNIFKSIVEGNHSASKNIKSSKNPILIYNSELLKRSDGLNILEMLKYLNYYNIFNKYCNSLNKRRNGLNMLTSSLSETGTNTIAKFLPINEKDLTNFSSLYFLNISPNNITNFKQITESKLLNYSLNIKNNNINKIFLNQNSNFNNMLINDVNKLSLDNKKFKNYFYLPNSMFYENEETFINTEGLVKRSTKLIFRKNNKSNWQILRKFLKSFKSNLKLLDDKNNQTIYFNSKKIVNFKNYIYFQYIATQSLTNLNFYLSIKTKPFIITFPSNFKPKTNKLINTKLKYWLNDFFNDSKDEYSQSSLILANCSQIIRTEQTNFFQLNA